MFSTKLLLLLALSAPCFSQVFYVTVTAAGNGYTSPPTVTASGGACASSEPTFTITLSGQTVSAVTPTFAGTCTLNGTAPALTFSGGGGSGAAATAHMISANIAILATPTVDDNGNVSVNGQFIQYYYECTLTVPAAVVPLYALTNRIYPMPGTSQSSQLVWSLVTGAAALQSFYNAAFASGILTVYDGPPLTLSSSTAISVAEGDIQSKCAVQQTNLNSWNPWSNYGTYYNGSWNTLGIP